MAYNFDNPMMEALLQHQQNALLYSPSMAAGTALKAVPEMAFDNPWATFLTALGTNLLGSGLTAYAGYRNQADTDKYAKEVAGIMSQGDAAKQTAALQDTPDLAFLSAYPALIEKQKQQQLATALDSALINKLMTKDPNTGKIGFMPGVLESELGMEAAKLRLQDQIGNRNTLKQLGQGLESSPYLKEMQQLAPRINQMIANIDSTEPMADAVFVAGAREALGQFKDDKESWGQFEFLRRLFAEPSKLTPIDKQNIANFTVERYNLLDQQHQNLVAGAQGRAGDLAASLTLPTLPVITRQKGLSGGLPSSLLDEGAQNIDKQLSSNRNFTKKVLLKTSSGKVIKVDPNDPRVDEAKKAKKHG